MFPIQLYWLGIHNSSSERGLSSTIVVPRHSGDLAPKTIKSIIRHAEEAIPPCGIQRSAPVAQPDRL